MATVYEILRLAAMEHQPDPWAKALVDSDSLFELFVSQGGASHFDYNGAHVSGFSEKGHGGTLTVGADFGKVLCPLLTLEVKGTFMVDLCDYHLLIVSRLPRKHPGLTIERPFALQSLTGYSRATEARISVEVSLKTPSIPGTESEKVGERGLDTMRRKDHFSAGCRGDMYELFTTKVEAKLALGGDVSIRGRWLKLRDRSPSHYSTTESLRGDFLSLLGTQNKEQVKRAAIAVFDLDGLPDEARSLKPEASWWKSVRGHNVEQSVIRERLFTLSERIADGTWTCDRSERNDKLQTIIANRLQQLDAFYAFDREALNARRREAVFGRATSAPLAGRSLAQVLNDAEVDAHLCHLDLFGHEREANMTLQASAEVSIAAQGGGVAAGVSGTVGFKSTSYRYQTFARDQGVGSSPASGPGFSGPRPRANAMTRLDVLKSKQLLSEARRRHMRLLVMTQDTQIRYFTTKLRGFAGAEIGVLNYHKDKKTPEERRRMVYNTMSYTSGVVYWRRQHGGVAVDSRGYAQAELGSGLCLGVSCDPAKLLAAAASPGLSPLVRTLMVQIGVSDQQLRKFVKDAEKVLMDEVSRKTSAVLLETSFAAPRGFRFKMNFEEQRTDAGSVVTVPVPEHGAAGFLSQLREAQCTQQALRLRVRRADSEGDRETKFKLGFKFVVEFGIELAEIERAGHEAVVDLHTHWFAPPEGMSIRAAPPTTNARREAFRGLVRRALAADLHDRKLSHEAAVPPVALLHQ